MSADQEIRKSPRQPSPYFAAVSEETRGNAKHVSPSALRNTRPIIAALQRFLPARGLILEIASGTGQHCVAFARHFAGLTFQPSDPDPAARASIDAWRDETSAGNILPPLALDVTLEGWWRAVQGPAAAIIAINLLHISPRAATRGLFAGAARLLAPDGMVICYGAFKKDGRHTAQSNARFDASLRHCNIRWGVRDIGDVTGVAGKNGLELAENLAMPSNNMLVVWRCR